MFPGSLMPSTSPVIIYRYDLSPYSRKIDNVLYLKNIPHQKVNVRPILPRPAITDLLGITYRRIPILAIGNDVYCDTSLISSALERRFPASVGYGTIFPKAKHGRTADTGLVKLFAELYNTTLFPVATTILPWETFSPAFIKDRSQLLGGPIDVQKIVASRDKSLITLSAHMSFLEQQVEDGREWLFDTELPSIADIAVHFIIDWVRSTGPEKLLLIDGGNFPNVVKWLERVSNYIQHRREQVAAQEITGEQAASIIASSAHEPYDNVGFLEEVAGRLGLKRNDQVQITPDDSGKDFSTVGKLVGVNRNEVVIEVKGTKGLVRCHFPQLGFTVKAVGKASVLTKTGSTFKL